MKCSMKGIIINCFIILSLMVMVTYVVASPPIVPQVSIISPEDGTATDQTTVSVTVSFNASANPIEKTKTNTGNVSFVILKIDNSEVDRYENSPNIKEGSHTFSVDVSGYSDRVISLQAFAYQGNINAGLVGQSNVVRVIIGRIIDHVPPQITITSPSNGTTIDTNTPFIKIAYSDDLSGINLISLVITINEIDRTSEFTKRDTEATFQITSQNPLPEGKNTIFATIKDNAGNTSETTSTFTVITIQPPPITPQLGYIHGKVLNSRTDQPLSDAIVTAEGIAGEIITDSEGKFAFPISNFPVTNVTTVKLTIKKGGFTYAQRQAQVVSTRDIAVDDIYLTPLDSQITTIGSKGGTAINSTGRIKIIFPDGAVRKPIEVISTQYESSTELPSPLPTTSFFTYAIDLQPDGIHFNEPVKVEIANHLGFSPGTPIPVGVWNPNLFRWEHESMAYVSSDGSKVEFEVLHFSPRDINLPVIPPPQARPANITANLTTDNIDTTKECGSNVSSTIGVKTGSLLIEERLPSIRRLGVSGILNFIYNSTTADPSQIITTETNVDPVTTIIPQRTGWKLNIEGNLIDVKFDGVSGQTTQRYLFGGKNGRGEYLKTGSYPYEINISNEYTANFATTNVFGGQPLQDTGVPTEELVPLSRTIKGRTIITNNIDNPYGAGWGIEELQRLHFDPDERILLSKGDGSSLIFSNRPFAYVTNWGSNNVSVIDVLTNAIIATVHVGWNPWGVAITPDGRYTYVTNNMWNNVSVIDTSTNTVVNTVPVGWNPWGIAITPDGNYAYVTNGWSANVSVIDTLTNTVVSTVGVGDTPRGVVITPDGRYAYVTNGGSNNISIIDTSSNTVADTVSIGWGSSPWGVDITLDGRYVYVTNNMWNNVSVIDTSTNTVIDTIPVGIGPVGVAITPDGRYTYVTNGGRNNVSVIDTSINTVVATVPVDTWPVGISITSDGNYAYVTNSFWGSNNVSIIDTSTNIIVNTVGVGSNPSGIAISPGRRDTFIPSPGDFSKLVRNNDDTYTRIRKDGTRIEFNIEGLQTSQIDRNGNITGYEYTDANNDGKVEELSKITLPTGQTYTFSYNANGKLASVTDSANRITQFIVDTNGDLTQIMYPDSSSKTFTYDANHLMLTKIDERGYTTEYIYDKYGRIKETKSPTRNIASVDTSGNIAVTREQEIHQFQPQDVIGLINDIPTGEGTPDNPAPVIRPETVKYTASEGCNCAGTSGQTDKFGAVSNVTDALNHATLIERDIDSNPTKITRPNGAITNMTYDTKGNPLNVTEQSIPATTTFTYEPTYNQVASITDPKGNIATITYDTKGNPTEIKDAMNNPTTLAYDNRGLLTSVKDAQNNPTTFTYDPITGNLLTTTDPLGNTTTLTYDTAGNVLSSQDGEGRITQFAYDTMNRLTSVTDADNKTTSYQYDLAGNLTKVIDANGNEMQFIYNETNQLIQTINPLGISEYFKYDANRNLAGLINRNGNMITYGYDLANQLVKKFLPDNQVTAFSYDTGGNLIGVIDPDSALSFTYDLARLSSISTGGSPYQPAITLSYDYDKNGNRISMIDPTGTTSYVYDTLNRLETLTNPHGKVTTFGYDTLSRRTSLTHANGVATSYNYDSASQLTSLVNALSATTISRYDYTTYDKVGNRKSMVEESQNVPTPGTHNYGYDVLNRLLNATHPQPENPAESFSYDAVGNRFTSHLSTLHRYDTANHLLEDDTYLYTYDNNGSLTEKVEKSTGKITRYFYDAENQLIAITSPDGSLAEYRYDGLGRRIEKKITPASGPIAATRYIYDDEDILLEYDATNVLIARYTHGPGIDEPLIIRRDGMDYFYLMDGLGSVKEITDSAGNIIQVYLYDSFGRLIDIQNTIFIQPYTYTAREYDAESRLYYYRARYYDPHLGRFLQQDPGLLFVDIPQSLNLFPYVANNPVAFVDPDGEIPIIIGVALVGGGIGAVTSAIKAGSQGQPIVRAAFRGFISGGFGSFAGTLTSSFTGNPFLAGAVSGAVADWSNQIFDSFTCGKSLNATQLATSTIAGGFTGAALGNFFPLVGRRPDIFVPRALSNYGPNSIRIINNKIISGAGGFLLNIFTTEAIKPPI